MSPSPSRVLALALLAAALPSQTDVATYTPFGSGCPGSAGMPLLEAAPGSLPRLGDTFTLRLSNLPVGLFGSQALVLFGFSSSDWVGMPLPLDLGRYGLPGCTGYISVDAAFLVTAPGSTAEWTLDIPEQAGFLGLGFFNQALVHDPGVNALGAVVTNAAAAAVGVGNTIIENFQDEVKLDRDRSSGTWSDALDPNGEATFGRIGRDGSHGDFSLDLASQLHSESVDGVVFAVYEMDTDNTTIPGINTTSGATVVVLDGVYYFSNFVLPPRTLLRFKGSHPPQIHVRGLVDIQGILDLRGQDVPAVFDLDAPPSIISQQEFGQPGGAGGPGGGDGGAGGDKPDGLGLQARYNGQDGGSARVLAGHAFEELAVDTAGRGSLMHPADGLDSSVAFTLPPGFPAPFQSGMVANGGGGGGHFNAGENGSISAHQSPDVVNRGPEGAGGALFPIVVPAPRAPSYENFLITGSGGGGGGGHPMFTFSNRMNWNSGGGGAGGGGAILIRAGHRIQAGADSVIDVTGGSGGVYALPDQPGAVPPAPGGGGSGGAIVLQCENSTEVSLDGFMDVRGGLGTRVEHLTVTMKGGDGSNGLILLETPLTGPLPSLGSVEPSDGAGIVSVLTDIDPDTAFQSTWYSAGRSVPPSFLNYVLEVEIDSVLTIYSDDQASFPGSRLAGPGEPLLFRVQGSTLDPLTGEPDPLSIRPWRFYVGDGGAGAGQAGLIDDAVTAFRFLMVLDRTLLGPGVDVKVKKLTITLDD